VYWANFGGDRIGRSTLGGALVQQDFITGANNPCGIAVDALTQFPLPSNQFSFRALKRNKRRGTATLTVEVPGPGSLELAGKGIRAQDSAVSGSGSPLRPKLRIRATGAKKRKLNETGSVQVKANVTYTPTGGNARKKSKRIKLIKRL
jgi:hypothetical protein